jgi:hypothetical protein
MEKIVKLAKMITPDFQKAIEVLIKQPLPLKTAYKMRNIVKKINSELDTYYSVRKELLNKYGKKKSDGSLDIKDDVVQFDDKNLKLFMKDVEELNSIEVELDPISIEEIGDSFILSAKDLIILEGILVY